MQKKLLHSMTPHSNPEWGMIPPPPQHSQKLASMGDAWITLPGNGNFNQ